MFKITDLKKVYVTKAGETVALKDINLTLPDKGMVFILGKSGCGKTTLLNVLGGLDSFDEGQVIADGKSLSEFKAAELDDYRNKTVGFVFQENNLVNNFTVKENIAVALELQRRKDDKKIGEILKATELEGYAASKANRLSGGQKQRVAIARAIVKDPKILLCDEPTGSLDEDTGEEIFKLLRKMSEDRLVIVVSHDRDSAFEYGDRVIELKSGAVVSDVCPREGENLNSPHENAVVSENADIAAPVGEEENSVSARKSSKSGFSPKCAYKIALPYLIARPVRLVICILICIITFTILGAADVFLAYKDYAAIAEVTQKLGIRSLVFDSTGNNSDKGIAELNKMGRVVNMYYVDLNFGFRQGEFFRETAMKVDEQLLEDYGYELIAGRMPQAEDEALITELTFEGLKYERIQQIKDTDDVLYDESDGSGLYRSNVGIYDTSFVYNETEDYLSVVEKKVYNLEKVKIVGILDTHCKYVDYLTERVDNYSTSPESHYSLDFGSMDNSLYVYSGANIPADTHPMYVSVPLDGTYKDAMRKMSVADNLFSMEAFSEEDGLVIWNYAVSIVDGPSEYITLFRIVALCAALVGIVLSVLFWARWRKKSAR